VGQKLGLVLVVAFSKICRNKGSGIHNYNKYYCQDEVPNLVRGGELGYFGIISKFYCLVF